MAQRWSHGDFRNRLHTRFHVVTEPELDLHLVEVSEQQVRFGQEQFALLFRGPLDAFLPQRIYRLKHELLGENDLFLVPVRKEPDGYSYEAVFSRVLEEPE